VPSSASFPDIAGHADARAFLGRLAREGRLPHALLLAGPEGIGKSLLARALARGKLCPAESPEGCGSCASCRAFEAGGHSDFLLLDPPGPTIPIAAIRGGEAEGGERGKGESPGPSVRLPGLVEWIGRKASGPRGKCAFVRDAERMNVFAQNALLKTLEEPPGDSLLLLTATSAGALLETVLSRCLCLRLRPLPVEEVERFLLARGGIAAADARSAARVSEGSIGEALACLPGEARRMRDLAEGRLAGEAGGPLREEVFGSLGGKSTAADRRALARTFLRSAGLAVRERWRAVVAAGGEGSYVPRGDPTQSLEDLLASTARALRDLEANVEPGLLIDLFAIDVARACRPSHPSATA
jgi:DNA polymerase-3 subunit delta'